MGGGRGKSSRKNAKTAHATGVDDLPTPNVDGLIAVDPRRIRFQYSKIRPHFSGCGRSVVSTLDSIRNGELSPSDLPPIQVLVGPVDEEDAQRWMPLGVPEALNLPGHEKRTLLTIPWVPQVHKKAQD